MQNHINLIRSLKGSPAYISVEANYVVDEYEKLVTLLKEYLKHPSMDGRSERQNLRQKLNNIVYANET